LVCGECPDSFISYQPTSWWFGSYTVTLLDFIMSDTLMQNTAAESVGFGLGFGLQDIPGVLLMDPRFFC